MSQFRVFLRMELKPLLGWGGGTFAYVLLMGLLFMAMGGGEGLGELAESYPEEILDALAIGELSTPIGFLSAQFTSLAPLVFGIFLVMFMTKHLAGAEESGTIDHVLARPVSRSQYYWHLVATAAAGYGGMLLVGAVAGVLGFATEATGRELLGMVGVMIDLIPYGLVFIGIGGLLGAAMHRRGRANAIGAGIVVLSFTLDLASRSVDNLTWLGYLTPIGYFARSDLAHGNPDIGYVVFSLVVAIAAAGGGWWLHERKQLYS